MTLSVAQITRRRMVGQLVKNELKWMWKEASVEKI
jgi:hypothetical protein